VEADGKSTFLRGGDFANIGLDLVCKESGVVDDGAFDEFGVGGSERNGMGLLKTGHVPKVVEGAVKLHLRTRLTEGVVEEQEVKEIFQRIAFDWAAAVPRGGLGNVETLDDTRNDQFGCWALV
jgi:hypothetical protein